MNIHSIAAVLLAAGIIWANEKDENISSPCVNYTCNNLGSCTSDKNHKPRCECTPEYTGEKCDIQIHYLIQNNAFCLPQKDEEYGSLLEARTACNLDGDCSMIYDLKAEHKNYVLCSSPGVIKPSNFFGSNLYKKCKFIFIRVMYA